MMAVNALRMAAVQALMGATSAGEFIFDSVVNPRELMQDEAHPVVCIYTDEGTMDLVAAMEFLTPETHTVSLSFEMFVGRGVLVTAGDGAGTVQLKFEDTDANQETYLRCLAYEILRALSASTPWAECFRSFIFRPAKDGLSEWNRGADADKGRRFALQRIVYKLEAIAEPVPGAPLNHVYDNFLTLLAQVPELADQAAFLREFITSPAVPSWEQIRRQLGMSMQELRAIGIAPVLAEETGEAPLASKITVGDERGTLDVAETTTLTEDGGVPVPLEKEVPTPEDPDQYIIEDISAHQHVAP